jgi:hypothetical protein
MGTLPRKEALPSLPLTRPARHPGTDAAEATEGEH